ncbi:MAG TPA: PAS domain-containing protein, partial [Bacteroidales bacterium]|nr:PAS domain-containing protein [Bacteroidales bacterium]
IDFLERVAQSIASAISSVKTNMRTQKLLEQSEQQAQELSAQEEEMRQNMEELKATQEEAARQKDEMENLVDAFHRGYYIVEYDPEEKIIEINNRYLNLLDLKREDVMGTHHSYKMKFTSEQEKNYKAFWDELRAGRVKRDTSVVEHKGKRYVFAETYTPIMNGDNQVKKILKTAVEASEFALEEKLCKKRG